MEGIFPLFLSAFNTLLNLNTLFIMSLGVVFGIFLGILPGIGATAALAILFPLTYKMSIGDGIIFLLAVYSAAEYGGSIPAILIRTPGTGSAAATVLDGYPLCKKGYPRKTLMISLTGGVFGGVFSTIIFILFAPFLAWAGLRFGPFEMFAVGVFGLSIICGLVGKSVIKGYLSAAIGLLMATVGEAHFSGYRFTFGQEFLLDGFPLLVVFIGFFAVPQAISMLVDESSGEGEKFEIKGGRGDVLSFKEARGLLKTNLRGAAIGTLIGIIPGTGAAIASFIAYNEEKRWSKRPKEFGTGVEEGVAAPETANNAVVAGAMVPTLTLGIPGSSAAALIMGLLIMKGIHPGPLFFSEQKSMVILIFTALLVMNLLLLLIGYGGLNIFSHVAKVPERVLGPLVMVLVLTGTYAYELEPYHPAMALGLGVFGYLMEKFGITTVPLVIAFIMGPIMEYNLFQALMISQGDISILYRSPLASFILFLALLSAAYGIFREKKAKVKK
jgi:putative tricarboxylic transport membrane protein